MRLSRPKMGPAFFMACEGVTVRYPPKIVIKLARQCHTPLCHPIVQSISLRLCQMQTQFGPPPKNVFGTTGIFMLHKPDDLGLGQVKAKI